ncbi:mucin-2-like [Raphanus sativus]|nr:mucin-2-like [Raphanus sativus]
MQNRWAIPGQASVVRPPSPTSGDTPLPPPFPPDPPPANLSPVQFPPLTAFPPMTRAEIRRSLLTPPTTDIVMVQAVHQTLAVTDTSPTTQSIPSEKSTEIGSQVTVPATENPNSVSQPDPEETSQRHFKILPPTNNSPIITNKASQLPSTNQITVAPSPVPTSNPSATLPVRPILHKTFPSQLPLYPLTLSFHLYPTTLSLHLPLQKSSESKEIGLSQD